MALALAAVAVDSFLAAPAIDTDDRCRPGETGQCFSRVRGVVEQGGSFYELKVRYDDGRRAKGLFMLDEEPELGTRVWLETWDGDAVAVYDSSTETRFRTRDWPIRWDWSTIVFTLILVAAAVACWPRRGRSRD